MMDEPMLIAVAMCNQLFRRRRIDTIDIEVAHSGGGCNHVGFVSAEISNQEIAPLSIFWSK
jgi:hypothetical protein